MKVEKINNDLFPVNVNDTYVKVTNTGNIVTITSCIRECKQTVQKVNADEYIIIGIKTIQSYRKTYRKYHFIKTVDETFKGYY